MQIVLRPAEDRLLNQIYRLYLKEYDLDSGRTIAILGLDVRLDFADTGGDCRLTFSTDEWSVRVIPNNNSGDQGTIVVLSGCPAAFACDLVALKLAL